MDTFMDKLAEKINAQEMIRANTSAELEELGQVKDQIRELKDCVDKMGEIAKENAGKAPAMISGDSDVLYILEDEVTQLGGDLAEVKSAVADIGKNHLETGNAVAGMTDTLSEVKDAVTEMSGSLAEIKENMTGLIAGASSGNVGPTEGAEAAAGVGGDLSEVKDAVAGVGGDLSEVKDAVAGVGGDLSEVKDAVAGVGGDLSEVKEAVAGVGGDLSEVKEAVAGVTDTLSEVRGAVTEMRGSLAEIKENMTGLIAGASGMIAGTNGGNDSLTEAKDAAAGVGGDFSEVKDAVAGVADSLSEVKDAVAEMSGSLAEIKENMSGMISGTIAGNDGQAVGTEEAAGVSGDLSEVRDAVAEMSESLAEIKENMSIMSAGSHGVIGDLSEVRDAVAGVTGSLSEVKQGIGDFGSDMKDLREGLDLLREEFAQVRGETQNDQEDENEGAVSVSPSMHDFKDSMERFMADFIQCKQVFYRHKDELTELSEGFDRLQDTIAEKLNDVTEASAARTEETMDALKHFLVERLSKQKAGPETSTSLEDQQAILDEHKVQLDNKLTGMHESLREGYHKESVKVYRNVQAAFMEENEKQTIQLQQDLEKLQGKNSMAMIFSVLAFVTALAGVVLQVLNMLKII